MGFAPDVLLGVETCLTNENLRDEGFALFCTLVGQEETVSDTSVSVIQTVYAGCGVESFVKPLFIKIRMSCDGP